MSEYERNRKPINMRNRLLKAEDVFVGGTPLKLKPPEQVCEPPPKSCAAPDDGEPEVSTSKGADGKVVEIAIKCSCGKEIKLNCDYLEEGNNDES